MLVIAPHPDDETLGAGGTLLRHIAAGDKVYWCIVTLALEDSSQHFRSTRMATVEQVSKAYGFADRFLLDYPAGSLDMVPMRGIVDDLVAIILKSEPDIVYCVSDADVNTDHDIVHRCAMVALKPAYVPSVKEVLLYEVPSSTNWAFPNKAARFEPDVYVNIEEVLEPKLRILSLFGPEVKEFPHPRSLQVVKSLAAYRGSSVNMAYAEAFQQVRRVIR
ncbi:MAG: PIG-L family deacetylase [Clostridia bacterium]|nr:PIG-L family deacetylase [Clostridia bacterium]